MTFEQAFPIAMITFGIVVVPVAFLLMTLYTISIDYTKYWLLALVIICSISTSFSCMVIGDAAPVETLAFWYACVFVPFFMVGGFAIMVAVNDMTRKTLSERAEYYKRLRHIDNFNEEHFKQFSEYSRNEKHSMEFTIALLIWPLVLAVEVIELVRDKIDDWIYE